jgi:hypothetical protein
LNAVELVHPLFELSNSSAELKRASALSAVWMRPRQVFLLLLFVDKLCFRSIGVAEVFNN